MSTIAMPYSVSRFIRMTVCSSIGAGARRCFQVFTPPACAWRPANIRLDSARTKLSFVTVIIISLWLRARSTPIVRAPIEACLPTGVIPWRARVMPR
jgi:hypothetical protein